MNTVTFTVDCLKGILNTTDIVIINFGLHYTKHENIVEYVNYVEDMAQALSVGNSQVVIRNTLPQHFQTEGGLYDMNNKPAMKYCQNETIVKSHPSNILMKYIAKKYNFRYLDEFVLFSSRWDLHFSQSDCTHYCYISELTFAQIIVLLQVL